MAEDNHISRVPWSTEPSLKDKANETGVDFDKFIKGLKENKNDAEIAEELEVTENLIKHLRRHFEKQGVHSIIGRD